MGGGRELEGERLTPKKATDFGGRLDNILEGIYASDLREDVIAMGVLSCKDVRSSSCGVHGNQNVRIEAIIYEGWPEQEYFIYTPYLPKPLKTDQKEVTNIFLLNQ